jgi:hypothetical protein
MGRKYKWIKELNLTYSVRFVYPMLLSVNARARRRICLNSTPIDSSNLVRFWKMFKLTLVMNKQNGQNDSNYKLQLQLATHMRRQKTYNRWPEFPFLKGLSRFEGGVSFCDKEKNGMPNSPIFQVFFFINDTDSSLWHASSSRSLDA